MGTDLVRASFEKPLAPVIAGSGGSSAGSSKGGSASESANTLRSLTYAYFIDVLSEGPIGGLVHNDMSIYYNQTALMNPDFTYNFFGVQWNLETGLPDQALTYSNPIVQTTYEVGVQMMHSERIVRTITDENVTAVKIIVEIPALLYTDQKTGSIYPNSTGWRVDIAPNGGDYVVSKNIDITNQKCNAPYQYMSHHQLPEGGCPWNIRVVRTAPDDVLTGSQSETFWISYIEQVQGKFSYPNTALVSTQIDADQFSSSSLPQRSYLIDGLIIQIPSNYDPVTRIYTGVWDGTFKTGVTSNPAWILYDILSNDRYGLGEYVDAAAIDKWSLYQIGQYCDQFIDDGFGGLEPRYTINCQITTRVEAYTMLQSICTAFRGMAYWAIGSVFATADMPKDPTKLVAPANVIDGTFNYSGTALNARHSVAVVSFFDPLNVYVPAKQAYMDDGLVAKYGYRQLDVAAFGCTSRGLAYRYGKWAIDTEQHSTETVEYEASYDHADLRPGDIIAIADPAKAAARIGGRLISVKGNIVVVDKAFAFTAGENYSFNCEFPDGTLSGPVPIALYNGNTLTLSTPLAQQPVAGAMWIISGQDVNPRQYQVMSIQETAENRWRVTALFYDPTKFARVEQNVIIQAPQYTLPRTNILPPTNLTVTENLSIVDGVSRDTITLTWTPGADFLSNSYRISCEGPNGSQQLGSSSTNSFDLVNPALGQYTFTVIAVGLNGVQSQPLTSATPFTVAGWAGAAAPYVTLLELKGQGSNLDFSGQNPVFDWQNNYPGSTYDVGQETTAGEGDTNPLFRNNVVTISDPTTDTILRTDTTLATTYTYSYENNVNDNSAFGRGPLRSFKIAVQIADNVGRISAPAAITVDNPVPELIIPTVVGDAATILVQYVRPSDPDFVGAFIWVSTDQNFDPLQTTPAYQGPNNIVSFPVTLGADGTATYYVRVAGYDQFGTSGLNISPAQVVNVGAPIFDNTAPAIPANIVLAPSSTTLADGTIQTSLTVTWDAVTSKNLGHYELQIRPKNGNFVTYPTSLATYLFGSLIANVAYDVQVRSISFNNYASAWSPIVSVTMGAKTTGPGAPSNLGAVASLKAAYLSWSSPSDTDLAETTILMSTDPTMAGALIAGTSQGTAFTMSGLTTGSTYYFQVYAVNTSNVPGPLSNIISVVPGQVANGDIAAGSITADKILAGTITGNLINVTTSLPATITVGASGVSIGAIQGQAANPAAVVNAGTTQINPGSILISGNISLASWRDGTDATKISGGAIQANTISANKLTIGVRGIQVSGMNFAYTSPATVSWTAGTVAYTDDNGAQVSVAVSAGSTTYTSGILYISFQKGNPTLSVTTSPQGDASYVLMATYTGGNVGLNVTYGAATIDGSQINANSITATNLSVSQLITNAVQIGGGIIQNTHLAAGITFDKMAGGTISTSQAIYVGGSNFVINSIAQNMKITDQNGTTRVVLGQLSTGATDYGIQMFDASGNLILATNGNSGALVSSSNPITSSNINQFVQQGSISDAYISSLSAKKISATSLSAISANLGTVTAGVLQSADGLVVFDLNNEVLTISDNS